MYIPGFTFSGVCSIVGKLYLCLIRLVTKVLKSAVKLAPFVFENPGILMQGIPT